MFIRCIENIESTRATPEIIFGYSAVLIGILGSANISPLGIPHMRGKVSFYMLNLIAKISNLVKNVLFNHMSFYV